MDKTEFLTIFRSFERLEIVKETLPTVVAETKEHDAKLIVHDSSVEGREEKWAYLKELNKNDDFFLILSSNMSSAHVCNMCLQLGQELYAPEYICLLEDDHGYLPGVIPELVNTMKTYYGKIAPNGLRYGLFTCCSTHNKQINQLLPDGNSYIHGDAEPIQLGRANACFRCAPTAHWNNVLKGLDTDEYMLSIYQVRNLNMRNYSKGFTALNVKNGQLCNYIHSVGRGASDNDGLRRWDDLYTASDPRSRYKK